mgnify:CR=1 FL=1
MVGRRWKAGNLFEEANEKLDFALALSHSRLAYTIFIINCQCREISQRLRAMAN